MIIERNPNMHDRFCDVEIGESFEYTDMLYEDIGYFSYSGEDLYMRIEPIKDKNAVQLKTGKLIHFDNDDRLFMRRAKIII